MIKIIRTFPLIIILLLSCAILTRNPDYEESSLVPGDNDVPGWRIDSDKTKIYGRDNIGGKLKDKAQVYEKYGVRNLIAAEYVRVDDPGKKIHIEIYRMNNPLNAFGIFSFERAFMYDNSNVCSNSYAAASSFFARKGEYYIKINSNKICKGTARDLIIFAEAICGRIVIEERPLPVYAALFGNNGLKNVIYRTVELPALPDISNFFLQKKVIAGKVKIVFFAKRGTGADSYREFSTLLIIEGSPYILTDTERPRTAFRKNGNRDFLFISVHNEWLFGVISAEDMAEGRNIINILFEEMIEFLNRNR